MSELFMQKKKGLKEKFPLKILKVWIFSMDS